MASDQSANLTLPYMAAAQAQKHVTHNEALRRLDAYVQLVLESVTAPAPPPSPAEGARWFVPAGAAGDFAGHQGMLAAYEAGGFDFLPLPPDSLAFIRDEDRHARFDGAAWVSPLRDAVRDVAVRAPLVLESVTAAAPPVEPEEGARWFVPAGAGGAFAGHAGALACFEGGGFVFRALPVGALAFVRDQWRLRMFDGGGFVSPLAARPQRAAIEAEVIEEDVILFGATTATTVAIPARAIVLGVSTRTLSGVTGAASYDCGVAGEPAKFGGGLGIAQGASNSGIIGPTAFYAATPVRLSANGGVFTGGRVRVSIHILSCPASAFPEREAAWWTQGPYLVDGTAPRLAADFVRERYVLSGAHGSSVDAVARTGGAKWVTGPDGNLVQVPANTLAFDYASGRRRLRLEGAATNLFVGSAAPAAQSITVTAQSYAISWWGSGNLERSGAAATVLASYTEPFGGRHVLVLSMAAGTLTLTPVGTVTRPQVEVGIYPTSYIETSSGTANRVTDICQLASGAAAAFGATAVGPTATVWRGRYRVPSSDGIHNLMSFSRGGVIKDFIRPSLSSDGATLRLQILTPARPDAGFDAITINVPADPSEVGVAVTWDGAGMMASANGQSPQTAARPGAEGISAVWFGTQAGFLAGDVAEVDELLVWPVKGSSAAIQSQARMWA